MSSYKHNNLSISFFASVVIILLNLSEGWVIPTKNIITPMKKNKTYRSPSSLHVSSSSSSSSSSNSKEEKMKRMEIIRSLQHAFYSTTAAEVDESQRSSFDKSTGIYTNLPLWRVSWTELPGRSNVLHVHDPRYTNMFEKLLHMNDNPPYYFGHLYLQKGSKSLSRGNDTIDEVSQLVNYEDYNMEIHGDGVHGSAVLGTLLRITDYRRIDDGRLLILVQAVERFVVLDVHQEFPYSVADVQLLPDMEELYYKQYSGRGDNDNARTAALVESLDTYLPYEFENTILSLPHTDEISSSDIYYSSIMEVIPYARYSSVIKPPNNHNHHNIPPPLPKTMGDMILSNQTSLEYQLQDTKILYQPFTINRIINQEICQLTTDDLEIQLWIAADQYIQKTSKRFPKSLLSLLPKKDRSEQEIKWPNDFSLLKLVHNLNDKDKKEVINLDINYPSYRRQKRFSYSAGLLLENVNELTEAEKQLFRHTLLRIPSVHGRLMYLLDCFQEKL